MRSTPPLMRNYSRGVVIKNLKKTKTKVKGSVAFKAVTVDRVQPTHTPPQPHVCYIVGKNPTNQTVSKRQKVMCFCDCENYTYYWEYANWKHGAGKIVNSNGEPPTTTNPGAIFGLCKHLYSLATLLVEKGW